MFEKYKDKSDEEIVSLVQSGKLDLFGLLVFRYEDKLMRYARKFLFNYEDIENVIQDVFVKAYVNIQSFDVSRRFSPWIYRIAHNEFINIIKTKGKEPVLFFDPDILFPHPLSKEEPDSKIKNDEIRDVLDRCIEDLDPKYREVVVLYYFEQLNYKEISDVLRIPISTVGVRLQRAKKQMQLKCQKLNRYL